MLTGGLAVGRAVAVAVLSGESDALAIQNGLDLLGMGGGVDAGENDLPLPQQRELAGLQLLHLGDEIGSGVDLLHGVHQLRAGLFIRLIHESGLFTGAPLDQGGMSVGYNGLDLAGGAMVRYSPFLMSFNNPNTMTIPPCFFMADMKKALKQKTSEPHGCPSSTRYEQRSSDSWRLSEAVLDLFGPVPGSGQRGLRRIALSPSWVLLRSAPLDHTNFNFVTE